MRRIALGSLIALVALFGVWQQFGQTVLIRVRSKGLSCSEIAAFDRMIEADRVREVAGE